MEQPPHGVDWLTSSPTATYAVGAGPDCRITLAVPSHDRRLVHWPKWLRKHGEHAMIDMLKRDFATIWQSNWCYFGTVPLSYFRAIEYADPERRAEAATRTQAELDAG